MANSGAWNTQSIRVKSGNFQNGNQHNLDSYLDQAIESFEASTSEFSRVAIKDSNVRARYQSQIKRIAQEVRDEVKTGKISPQSGAEFCHQMRNKILVEVRQYNSAVGLSYSQSIKKAPRPIEYYLDKYAQEKFSKPYTVLTDIEKKEVYYIIIESSTKDQATVTSQSRKLRIMGKVGIIVTVALAGYEIYNADDKVKESVHQGFIVGGGVAGGALAGLGVSAICGPGAPVCAIATVLIGSIAGGLAGEAVNESYNDEISEFIRWEIN